MSKSKRDFILKHSKEHIEKLKEKSTLQRLNKHMDENGKEYYEKVISKQEKIKKAIANCKKKNGELLKKLKD